MRNPLFAVKVVFLSYALSPVSRRLLLTALGDGADDSTTARQTTKERWSHRYSSIQTRDQLEEETRKKKR